MGPRPHCGYTILNTETAYVADAALTAVPVMLLARIVTVFAAETKALNTKPAAGAAGKPNATSSFTEAPVTVIVKSSEAAAAIDAKSKAAEPVKTDVNLEPVPEIKPFKLVTGPVKVVDAMIYFPFA
jgi:hypothetical protein